VTEVDPRWYDSFFLSDDWLAIAQAADDEERTRTQVEFVVERLGLGPAARVLDLACGHGRHAVELARRGLRVTGLDISEPSLAIARERAAEQSVELELLAGDMRELPWRDEFDAVLNLWTAFGYFADEADDARVLAAVARALRAGGALLLDTLNVFWLARSWQAHGWQELDDGRLMIEDRAYDHLAGRKHGRLDGHRIRREPQRASPLAPCIHAPGAARAPRGGRPAGRRHLGRVGRAALRLGGAAAHRSRARLGIKENGVMSRNRRPWSPCVYSRAHGGPLRRHDT